MKYQPKFLIRIWIHLLIGEALGILTLNMYESLPVLNLAELFSPTAAIHLTTSFSAEAELSTDNSPR